MCLCVSLHVHVCVSIDIRSGHWPEGAHVWPLLYSTRVTHSCRHPMCLMWLPFAESGVSSKPKLDDRVVSVFKRYTHKHTHTHTHTFLPSVLFALQVSHERWSDTGQGKR